MSDLLHGCRVLLVEDDNEYRNILEEILREDCSAIPTCCASGKAGVNAYNELRPHLLITDIDLGPGITGLELAQMLRSRDRDLPMVIMSGNDAYAPEALRFGPFFKKPMRLLDLIKACERELEKVLVHA